MVRAQTRGDPGRLGRVLAGLRRYQEAPRAPAPPAKPIIAERHGAVLRDHGGEGPDLFVVPSLINPPTVLDLPGKSLLAFLAGQGNRVLLLDWGDAAARRDSSIAGHVEQIALPLLAALPRPPALAGYCLGGTMALAMSQLAPVRSLALIATPWRFCAFGTGQMSDLASLWSQARAMAERLGVLPMEVLQAAFWQLDPERTVAKYEILPEADKAALATFVQLEDWANDGPPLPFPAARELLEDFFNRDLTGSGGWQVGGRTIDPPSLSCPVLDIASQSDAIVPIGSAAGVGEPLVLRQGHVGMIVGSQGRAALWEPLAGWLSRVSPTC